ncbi:aminotransferase class IV [Clostridium paraputrificum]|uniref:aminotransferase class IV n=1 Tax=Clostridium TaxID=1485 RepID=UPI003D32D9D8
MRRICYKSEEILLDEGAFFARGVFETILWLNKPIFLDEHIDRLKKGMSILGLQELEEVKLLSYLEGLSIQNKAVKITVTPLNIIITTRDIPYKEEDYIKGVTLTISKVRRNSTSRLCYVKSTGYIENILEKEVAKHRGYGDVLFLNEKGYVTETSCANIFIVRDGIISTPRINDGLLSGIIRKWIVENCKVHEKNITLKELEEADEVFITNSLMGVMPVKLIDKFIYSKDIITSSVRNKYEDDRIQVGGI